MSTTQTTHLELADKAIGLLIQQPNMPLLQLAAQLGVSAEHLQRVFSQSAGLSPKQFGRVLIKSRAWPLLQQGVSSLGTSLELGLSSPSRLHDTLVQLEALSPGQVAQRGQGLTLDWGVGSTPLGDALVAQHAQGVVHWAFLGAHADSLQAEHAAMVQRLPKAHWVRNDSSAQALLARALPVGTGRGPLGVAPLRVWVQGSAFQIKVWEALLATPAGQTTTYGQLAQQVGNPGAARAVGTAVASNTVAVLIPCHRVIRQTGETGQYRWGPVRKQALLGVEHAQQCGADAA